MTMWLRVFVLVQELDRPERLQVLKGEETTLRAQRLKTFLGYCHRQSNGPKDVRVLNPGIWDFIWQKRL